MANARRTMTNRELQRRHDDDAFSLGDRVANELLRLSRTADVVPLGRPDIPVADDAVAEIAAQHTSGTAYGCPACQAATT
jgi:hypothetical protein